MAKKYQAPAVTHLGSLHQHTMQTFNKVGSNADQFTGAIADATGVNIVGSTIPVN